MPCECKDCWGDASVDVVVRNAPWLATTMYRRRLRARYSHAVAHRGKVEVYARVRYETPSGTVNSMDARDWQRWEEQARPMNPVAVAKMLNDRRARRGSMSAFEGLALGFILGVIYMAVLLAGTP